MSSPLIDTLFRPTTSSPVAASALPVRERGTRTRAGNAMSRTRQALLRGAAIAVAESGTKITMAQVAAAAGVAKATLYNHFRTREAVLAALAVHQVEDVISEQDGKPLASALVDAAAALSRHPVRAALERLDPASLASLGRVDLDSAGWGRAREAVSAALAADSRAGADIVLRWLASHLISPSRPAAIAEDVAILLAGLPVAAAQALDDEVSVPRPA